MFNLSINFGQKTNRLEEIVLKSNKKVYLASDFHLGAPNHLESLKREKVICRWLDKIKADAQVVFLVGDLFDFWFEHKQVAPKGFVRFLGKLAELSDSGIRLIIFEGNHDMWMRDYFQKEFAAEIYREPREYKIRDKTFLIGHGDGLGPGDRIYKFLKLIFENGLTRWMFRKLLHPDLSIWLGKKWAEYSWNKHEKEAKPTLAVPSIDDEFLYQYCLEQEKNQHRDYYIFGHRHLKLSIPFGKNSQYINLGDWIKFYSYAEFDGKDLGIRKFEL